MARPRLRSGGATSLAEGSRQTPSLANPLGDGSDATVSQPAESGETAPPVTDEVSRDDETSQQDDGRCPGQERQVGTEHESQNRKELEHWFSTVGRWGYY